MKTRTLLTTALLCLAGPALAQDKAAAPAKAVLPKTTETTPASAPTPAPAPATPTPTGPAARAELKDQKGKAVGEVTLTETPEGILIKGMLKGLPAGDHAFHVHETGKCEAPFKSAGGHLNPGGKKHGVLSAEGKHEGDLPNIHVGKDGTAQFDTFAEGMRLADLMDTDGAAVVVHATSDDYKSDPAGNAGDRIACGVVQPAR